MNGHPYTISQIAAILTKEAFIRVPTANINHLLTDTRTVIEPATSLFFAIRVNRDGHDFIKIAYDLGIRNFVISDAVHYAGFPEANFLKVADTVTALQTLAAFHRSKFNIPVIGITGSNGKTVVKEWLFQLMHQDKRIVKSPNSFNSQIGVPLSVWQIQANDELAIFEAGISKAGEMRALTDVIRPGIGILTNIGEAHSQGFASNTQKLKEKLILFEQAGTFIYSPAYTCGLEPEQLPGKRKFSWGINITEKVDLQVKTESLVNGTLLSACYLNEQQECFVPFKDAASVENIVICWATMLVLGYSPAETASRLSGLTPVSMRLELVSGVDNCSVIDDTYSADLSSLAIALDFLNLQHQHPKHTVILSDVPESGKSREQLYAEIARMLQQKKVDRLIGIGQDFQSMAHLFNAQAIFYPDTEALLEKLPQLRFANETILVKGARKFRLERISRALTLKIHDTVLEVNLGTLADNLQYYRSRLKPGVKVMAMVKAFSYGSGSFEVANLLEHRQVDYLAVAYADEGIALRKAGIKTPVMVMSPEPSAFEAMLKYRLEPEIYSLSILKSFLQFIQGKRVNIHLKLDTGMHRLGFEKTDIPALLTCLTAAENIHVQSVFTHLVASDDRRHDDFTSLQLARFNEMYEAITMSLVYKPLRHALNTSGISRFPDEQMDMVRLGIGLYGIDVALPGDELQDVLTLKTTVSQVKMLPPGETVGYSRNGKLPLGGKVATVKIGYADGYNRKFGNGQGKMLVKGRLVPTIGSICMDMCMLDVTGIEVHEGDEVIVFNNTHGIMELAKQLDTIPYEMLTNISQRVKRVYFY